MRWIRRLLVNGIFAAVGVMLQRYAVEIACSERGYWAIGGEWLVLPVCIMAGQVAISFKEILRSEGD